MTIDYLAAQKYARPVVMRMLRSREDTDDCLQDATIKALRHISSFRGSCKFETWFCRIAINEALMRLRKQRPHCEIPLDLPERRELEPDSIAIAAEKRERLLEAAAKLTPKLQREFLSYLEGESTAISAARRGVSEEAAKGGRFRIRNKLRVALAGVV